VTFPPGPRLPALWQFAEWWRRPLPFLESCARKLGPTFTLDITGLGRFVVVTAPEDVRAVLAGAPRSLPRRRGQLDAAAGRRPGLAHPPRRGALPAPPAARPAPDATARRLQVYARLVRDATDEVIASWPVGRPFPILPEAQRIVWQVMLRAVVGVPDPLAPVAAAIQDVLDMGAKPWVLLFQRDWAAGARAAASGGCWRAPTSSSTPTSRGGAPSRWARTSCRCCSPRATRTARRSATATCATSWSRCSSPAATRRRSPPRGRSRTSPPTPTAAERARTDADYLDAAIREALRLRPIFTLSIRQTVGPERVGGYDLPAGTVVAPCIYLCGQRHDEPGRFMPERFLGVKPDPLHWFPFGGGVRRCVGMAFALFLLRNIVGRMLQRTRLRGDPPRTGRRHILIVPAGGGLVTLDDAP